MGGRLRTALRAAGDVGRLRTAQSCARISEHAGIKREVLRKTLSLYNPEELKLGAMATFNQSGKPRTMS
jgi:hypothetical protein